MPNELFQLATVTRVFSGEAELAEALGFPEVSALDDAERKWRACLQSKTKAVLEDAALSAAIALHRRKLVATVELDSLELNFEPPRRSPDWEQPLQWRVHFVRWAEDDLHHAFVPGLGMHVFATRAGLLAERVEAHVRLLLAGRGRRLTLRRLAEVARVTELRLGQLEVTAQRKTPKQIAVAGEATEETKSVMDKLAEELPPLLPRGDDAGKASPPDSQTTPPAAFELDSELKQLAEALAGPHRRSVLIVGPPGCGKTALARELARRRRDFGFGHTPFWSTSGARLMTGPIGFGMWQERCQQMCREVSKASAILHLNNLGELLEVGKASRGEQSVGSFLRPWLALLDEGRLTDALGCVTDFTQTVILLTSNLGTRESRSRVGFNSPAGSESDDAVFVSAAEKFFRPEFFNRLDRIIPFRALERAHLEGIARQLIVGLLGRDGLRRRNGLLNVTPEAMTRLVELGHHPQLGARALKRVIEREVAQPMAELLAALPPGTPMIANLATKAEGFALAFRDLTPAPRSVFWPEAVAQPRTPAAQSAWTGKILDGAYAALDRIEAELERNAPTGKIELGALPPEQARYFFCREHLKKVDRLAQAVERAQEAPRRAPNATRLPRAKPVKLVVRQFMSGKPRFERRREAVALEHDLADLDSETVAVADSPLSALLREIALLEALAARPAEAAAALLVFRACVPADSAAMFRLAQSHAECLGYLWGTSTAMMFQQPAEAELLLKTLAGQPPGRTQAIYLQGLNVRQLLPNRTNTILTRRAEGGTGIVLMTLEPATTEAEARVRAKQLADSIDALEPESFGPVIQCVVENKSLTDFRTGLVVPAQPSAAEFRALLLSALALPPEVAKPLTN